MGFLLPVDIANRGLQHLGAVRIDQVQGFAENSKNASAMAFCYDKLRPAELRRNVWRFATKKAVLRAIDSNTLLLAPTLWTAGTTYFVASIVADQNGTVWISQIPNNLGNDPLGPSNTWVQFFGPLTVMLYDSSKSYFVDELVYTAAGDGTNNVYLSRVNTNAVHPALPNQWSVQTVYYKNQVVQAFPAWSNVTTYSKGQAILYTDGNIYASLINSNTGNTPPSNASSWALMPVLTLQSQAVPVTSFITPPPSSPVSEWSQITTYGLGSFVMFNANEYVSLVSNNTGNFPNASGSTSWIVVSNGTFYMSLIDLNLGNNPATTTVAAWSASTTYAINNQVTGTDGVIYTSVGNGNIGNNPIGDGGIHWTNTGKLSPWTISFTQGGGNSQWVQIGGAAFPLGVGLSELNITYPAGSGPSSQTSTKNVFRLPANFLREAPQDPKLGGVSFLGAPSGLNYTDWEYEGNFIISRQFDPIVYRFVVDFVDVSQMDAMFCEGLAARMGMETCEEITQSSAKWQKCNAEYRLVMTEARIVNGIETGATEPASDDYIECRA